MWYLKEKNMKFNIYKKLLTAVLIVCFHHLSYSQKAYKKLGVGLPYPIASCATSPSGDLWAVCNAMDSMPIYAYDFASKIWSRKGVYDSVASIFNSFFSNDSFYLYADGTNLLVLRNAKIEYYSPASGKCFTFKDTAYFSSINFDFNIIDSSYENIRPYITKFYNGVFDTIYKDSSDIDNIGNISFIKNDSIFYFKYPPSSELYLFSISSRTEKLIGYFSATLGIWSMINYADGKILGFDPVNPARFNMFNIKTGDTKRLYSPMVDNFGSLQNQMYNYNNTVYNLNDRGRAFMKVDSIGIDRYLLPESQSANAPTLFVHKNHLIAFENDTTQIENTNQFIYEIDTDSLQIAPIDTITVFIFNDRNKNNVYDVNIDTAISATLIDDEERYQKSISQVDSTFVIYQNTNRNWKIDYAQHCYFPSFSGSLKTDFSSTKHKDTLVFPMQFKSSIDKITQLTSKMRSRLDTQYSLNFYLGPLCENTPSAKAGLFVLPTGATFVSSSIKPSSISGQNYYFDTTSTGFTHFYISIIFPFPTFSVGDSVTASFYSLDNIANKNIVDSSKNIIRLVYSYDPNEKLSTPSGLVSKSPKNILYTIHFQNTGTDYAKEVRIEDELDPNLLPSSLKQLEASHSNLKISIQNNKVIWEFKDINLLPQATDEYASRGFVTFEVSLQRDLAIGETLKNKASIYFDKNLPIVTNEAIVAKDSTVSVITHFKNNNLAIYPNPTDDKLVIENKNSHPVDLIIYSILGNVISQYEIRANAVLEISLLNLSAGMYIVTNGTDGEVYKIIKE